MIPRPQAGDLFVVHRAPYDEWLDRDTRVKLGDVLLCVGCEHVKRTYGDIFLFLTTRGQVMRWASPAIDGGLQLVRGLDD
jgi:hypothetical protein